MEKYLVWHIQGGLGKNVASTSLIGDLKKRYSDRKLVMVVSWPEIFLNNKGIDRLSDYSTGLEDFINITEVYEKWEDDFYLL